VGKKASNKPTNGKATEPKAGTDSAATSAAAAKATEAVPPSDASADDPFNVELTFPDDGALAAGLRKFDRGLGLVEQGLLFAILTAVVLSASAQAIGSKLFHHSFEWSFDVVRDGVFAIAMLGAAFASHQQRHLAMDLLSNRLTPRGKLVLRVALGLFTIGIVAILVRAGFHLQVQVAKAGGHHMISMGTIAYLVPGGASLIILHSLIHTVIDADYLVRNKLPPTKMRMGH
jgi:TRAP-type C4-dicarboxylate transport system permease small subunit